MCVTQGYMYVIYIQNPDLQTHTRTCARRTVWIGCGDCESVCVCHVEENRSNTYIYILLVYRSIVDRKDACLMYQRRARNHHRDRIVLIACFPIYGIEISALWKLGNLSCLATHLGHHFWNNCFFTSRWMKMKGK